MKNLLISPGLVSALIVSAFVAGCGDAAEKTSAGDPATETCAKNFVLPDKTACAEAGVSRETFDFGWRFAKFGRHDDCLAAQEPGAPKASSEQAHNPAENAVDGNIATRWCAAWPGDASLTVDFGRVRKIAGTKILWEMFANYRYKIFGSSDGKVWHELVDRSERTETVSSDEESLSVPATVRYMRIDVSPSGYAWASIREWTFEDASGAPVGVAKASSEQAHNPAENAVDGNIATRWCAAWPGDASLTVDFGRVRKIAGTKILWEMFANYRYKIFGSSDGKVWHELVDRSKRTETVSSDEESLSAPATVRYVRIDVSPTGYAWASIREWTFADAAGAPVVPEAPGGAALRAFEPAFDDSAWRALDLPHDWGVESKFLPHLPNQTASLPWDAVGWYRKEFSVPAAKSGKKFFLDFDGVMMMPKIYVNGQLAGEWKYGYSSFRVDITPFLKFGEGEKNVVAVRAENLPNSTRWYPGAGIYRHVWLVEKNPAHIAYNGVWVRTPEISAVEMHNGKRFAGTAKILVETATEGGNALVARHEISKNGKTLVRTEGAAGVPAELALANVELWDTENPALYTLTTTLLDAAGTPVDQQKTVFGVRKAEWKPDGFYLNERRVPIQGVCQHHDLGALGAAAHTRAMERQIEILKSFGVNAIRTSHNPPAPEFLDLCDRMGILVDDELLDCWKHLKEGKTNGYNLFWNEWRERDVRNFVTRDRNRPCVIMWSVGNEIEEQHSADGPALAKDLVERFHRYDPTRPTTIGSNDIRASRTDFGKQFDVFGFNYKPNNYAEFARNNPNTPFYGSETCSTVSSRGFYSFPINEKDFATAFWRRNFCDSLAACQVGDYGIYATGWGSTPDIEFGAIEDEPRTAGQFVWTGFDYLGEPTPWNLGRKPANDFRGASPEEIARLEAEFAEILKHGSPSRSSYFGIVDLCGFRKNVAWLWQSQWLPDVPMAHILPHWNWQGQREGKITPVFVFTSGDEAELFLNGKSLGRRAMKKGAKITNKDLNGDQRERFRLTWMDVRYEPGTLEVVAYKNGVEWARDKVETTGVPAGFTAEADRTEIRGDGRDLSYVTISVRDAQGRVVPTAKNLFNFSVRGDAAEIVGVCNGDATDHASMKGHKMKAFSGLAQVILRSKRGACGTAELIADGGELGARTLRIEVK